jgi:hypothetical protein
LVRKSITATAKASIIPMRAWVLPPQERL